MNKTAAWLWSKYFGDSDEGSCRYCSCTVLWRHYGRRDRETGWEIEHSRSQKNDGSWHPNNLRVSCWRCNAKKGRKNATEFRREHGHRADPYTYERSREVNARNAGVGAAAGVGLAVLGAAVPPVGIGMALLGAFIGHRADPRAR